MVVVVFCLTPPAEEPKANSVDPAPIPPTPPIPYCVDVVVVCNPGDSLANPTPEASSPAPKTNHTAPAPKPVLPKLTVPKLVVVN